MAERAVRSGGRGPALAAMLLDAWNELRVNRLRVLLALVGITVAAVGLTAALGGGTILREIMLQNGERSGGRTATVVLSGDFGADPAKQERVDRIPNDFGVAHWTRTAVTSARAWTPSVQLDFQVTLVDPAYATVYRTPVVDGRFLNDDDAAHLAPSLVVNEAMWQALGQPDLRTDPRVTLVADGREQTATIVGVAANMSEWDLPMAMALYSPTVPLLTQVPTSGHTVAMWVPEGIGDELAQRLNSQLEPLGVNAVRADWAQTGASQLISVQLMVIGAAVGMFVLGALGLVNINLVTMQHRVREIGIRRSYGATTGRIFVGVLLESVVAAFLAGAVGVTVTVIALTSPMMEAWLRTMGVYEPIAFPVDAALIGLAASTFVGALAGALPAWRATRVQIIDAIRY